MRPKIIRASTVPISLNLLLEGQLRMLSDEYELVAVSSPGPDLDAVAAREGVRVVPIPMERRISLWKDLISLLRLIALFRREKPQIVHSMTPKAGLLSMLAARICRVPVRIHTFTGLVFPSAKGLKKLLLIATDRLTCSCATYINPEGLGVKNTLSRITSRPLHIIGNGNVNGIDLTYFDRTPEVVAKAAEIRQSRFQFTFCFVGRIVGDKGINELAKAFVRLNREHPTCRLLLVGSPEPELDPPERETEEILRNHPAVTCAGWQNDIRPFLAASDVFVFPSYREGFPNVVLQAGAMGIPCIVTDINGCNEIIKNGVNGLIIPPKDAESLYKAMNEYLISPAMLSDHASHSRKMIAERYDRQYLWSCLRKVYKEQIS